MSVESCICPSPTKLPLIRVLCSGPSDGADGGCGGGGRGGEGAMPLTISGGGGGGGGGLSMERADAAALAVDEVVPPACVDAIFWPGSVSILSDVIKGSWEFSKVGDWPSSVFYQEQCQFFSL